MSHEEAIAKTFDEWASSGRGDRLEEGHGDVVDQVIAGMDIRPGQQVLDLGCGNGWATRRLAKAAAGAGAVGVDVSPKMIARAEELHSFTIRARYEVGAFGSLDFPDDKFDRLFSMEAIYYAPDVEKALTEAHRVLKSGGTADIIIDFFQERPSTETWAVFGREGGFTMHFLSEADWKVGFERAGFADVSLRRVVDSRGPGDEASFEPGAHHACWADRLLYHEAGSLWIRAAKK